MFNADKYIGIEVAFIPEIAKLIIYYKDFYSV